MVLIRYIKKAPKIIHYLLENLTVRGMGFLINTSSLGEPTAFIRLISAVSFKLFKLKIVETEWLDEYTECKKIEMREVAEQYIYGPSQGRRKNRLKVKLPAVFNYHLTGVTIINNSSSFIKNNKIIIERIPTIDESLVNYNGGHLKYRKKSVAVIKYTSPIAIKEGLFLAGNGSFNYYHWLIEIIPKLQFSETTPILVSDDIDKYNSFKELLTILAANRVIIKLKKDQQYLVERMVYTTTPNNLPFNLINANKFEIGYFLISNSSLNYLRSNILKEIQIKKGSSKIFLKRDNNRRSYNQDEIELILTKLGFVSVNCENFSFIDQVQVFNNADFIVGPTGAAWSNLIFGKPGSKALCWMAEEYGDFSAFSTLAEFTGIDLRYLYFQTGEKNTSQLYNKEYYIKPNDFEQQLAALLEVNAD